MLVSTDLSARGIDIQRISLGISHIGLIDIFTKVILLFYPAFLPVSYFDEFFV